MSTNQYRLNRQTHSGIQSVPTFWSWHLGGLGVFLFLFEIYEASDVFWVFDVFLLFMNLGTSLPAFNVHVVVAVPQAVSRCGGSVVWFCVCYFRDVYMNMFFWLLQASFSFTWNRRSETGWISAPCQPKLSVFFVTNRDEPMLFHQRAHTRTSVFAKRLKKKTAVR